MPVLSGSYALAILLRMLVVVAVFFPALIILWALFFARRRLLARVQRHLRAKGYDGMTAAESRAVGIWEARRLAAGVKRLPPRDEVAVTPSWGDETKSLFRLLRILANQRTPQR